MIALAPNKLKLNLGSRNRNVPGFKNVDIHQHPGVDYVMDVSDLSHFADGSVSEILGSNILEHFPHAKTLSVLKEWHRVLAPLGVLYLSVPDFSRALELHLKHQKAAPDSGLSDWVVNFLYGDQGYETAFHYTAFDWIRLRNILHQAGFPEVCQVDSLPVSDKDDCSNLKSNLDGKLVCLNVVAIKGDS